MSPAATLLPSAGATSVGATVGQAVPGMVKLNIDVLTVRSVVSQLGIASTYQLYVPGLSCGGVKLVVVDVAKTGGVLVVPRWMSYLPAPVEALQVSVGGFVVIVDLSAGEL